MPNQVVCVVYEYDAPTPEEAAHQVRQSEALYDGPVLVVAGRSLRELPALTTVPGHECFGQRDAS